MGVTLRIFLSASCVFVSGADSRPQRLQNSSQGMRFVKLLCQSIARTRWSERYAEYPKVLFRDVPNSVHLSVGETGTRKAISSSP